MIYGTHNSGTGGKLLWWLTPIGGLINLTSKCQDLNIEEQLNNGVRWFNLQVAYYKNQWRFSHGLALYKEDVIKTLEMLCNFAKAKDPIYVQVYLDRSFWCKQNQEEFLKLGALLNQLHEYNEYFNTQSVWVEGTDIRLKPQASINGEEHYWTQSWAKDKSIWDKLPLPRRHARKYNQVYIKNCSHDYLMLDFYNKYR
jgi:hypothetical protein